MMRASNEKELINILKIIAEESVKKTKKDLFESADSAQQRFSDQLKMHEKVYGVNLSEQEDEARDTSEQEDTDASTEEDRDDSSSEEPKELGDSEEFSFSFDSVVKNINTLRAGRSTKDKEIKEELLTYYDRLDEDERKILHIFLRELSQILQGAIDGDDALDPSDAPLYADIIIGSEDGNESSFSDDRKEKQSKPSGSEGSEDASPPIKVNESQNLREVRRKFKNLLKRI
jgi:hypothetical protein